MNKAELVDYIAQSAELPKTKASQALNGFIEAITKSLQEGNSVALTGFGVFNASDRKAREGRNPQTGEPMQIKASRVPRFKAGKALKDALN
jgi:DNA-binding protein HU-beta